MLGEVQTKALI